MVFSSVPWALPGTPSHLLRDRGKEREESCAADHRVWKGLCQLLAGPFSIKKPSIFGRLFTWADFEAAHLWGKRFCGYRVPTAMRVNTDRHGSGSVPLFGGDRRKRPGAVTCRSGYAPWLSDVWIELAEARSDPFDSRRRCLSNAGRTTLSSE